MGRPINHEGGERLQGCRCTARMAAAFALFFSLAAFARADEITVRTEVTPEAARIIFTWLEPVSFQTSVMGRELVLQFERAIEAPQIEGLSKQAPAWIEGASAGYDTVLLLASRDVDYHVEGVGNEVIVSLATSVSAVLPSSGEGEAAQLRLDLLQARLLSDTGQEAKALQSLRQLAAEHPKNVSVLAGLADIENRLGRWQRADTLYRQALQYEPSNQDLLQARAGLLREKAPRVQVETERKMVENRQREQIVHTAGHGFLASNLRIGFVLDQNFLDVKQIRSADGKVGSFAGFRQRGEVYLEKDLENGSWIRGSLFAGRSDVGLGFEYAARDTRGESGLRLDFRRPYWEFIEGVVNGGMRDRLEFRRRHRLLPRLSGNLAAALNRYGIAGDSDAAISLALESSLSYTVTMSRPLVAVEYYFDGESRRSLHMRIGTDGSRFAPLPLVSREVHAFQVVVANPIGRHLRAEGFAGFAWDLLGGQGRFYGGRLAYDTRHLGAQVWFDRRLYTVLTSEKVRRLAASFFWRF